MPQAQKIENVILLLHNLQEEKRLTRGEFLKVKRLYVIKGSGSLHKSSTRGIYLLFLLPLVVGGILHCIPKTWMLLYRDFSCSKTTLQFGHMFELEVK